MSALAGGKKILIVEDDEDIAFALTCLLEGEGYVVKTAGNGLVALNVLRADGLPQLILLDMKLPVMDGWEFAAEFHARHDRSVPIVVMTAAADAEQRAKETDADSWLAKPFVIEELLAKIEKYAR